MIPEGQPRRRVLGGLLTADGTIALGAAATPGVRTGGGSKPTVVLVHGVFADASGWNDARLLKAGYPVIAVADPLRDLAGDLAYVSSIIDTIPGPVILVGHSYDGEVITNAARRHASVKALVYAAAFAPDEGESALQLARMFPGSKLEDALVMRPFPLPDGSPGGIDGYIDPAKFHDVFAQDLPPATAGVMAASQRPSSVGGLGGPSGAPAWKSVPSWYLVATADIVIPPILQRFMAKWVGSTTVEVKGASHVVMMSHWTPWSARSRPRTAPPADPTELPEGAVMSTPDTIVLIHGFWVTPRSWEHWIPHYEKRGYRVLAPAYPGFEVEVESLNADPTPIEQVTVAQIVESLATLVRGLDKPPILIGHSAGGVFVQLLLDDGLGAAAVAINSAPTEGVAVVPLTQIKSAFPVLKNPANRHRAVGLNAEQWQYAFTNTFSEEESRALYERYAVPASGGIFWDSALATLRPGHQSTYVDYHNDDRAPLLFVSGENDHLMPPKVQQSNARHYKSDTVTEIKEFPGRPHLLPAAPGWEEVADYALDWAASHAR
jgi:pimeloyl-ACP methyl ester carboxylesterase